MSVAPLSGPSWSLGRDASGITTITLQMRMEVPGAQPGTVEWMSVDVAFDFHPNSDMARELESRLLHFREELAARVAARSQEPPPTAH